MEPNATGARHDLLALTLTIFELHFERLDVSLARGPDRCHIAPTATQLRNYDQSSNDQRTERDHCAKAE
jgi:hypothetical protein